MTDLAPEIRLFHEYKVVFNKGHWNLMKTPFAYCKNDFALTLILLLQDKLITFLFLSPVS